MSPITSPLRRLDVLDRWVELAAELGLDASPDDLDLGRPDDARRLYSVAAITDALDAAVLSARNRRPVYRLAMVDGLLALLVDPRALEDNLAAALGDVRYALLEERRLLIAAEVRATGVARVALRWGLGRSTVYRWLDVPNSPSDGTADPANAGEDSQNDAA